MRILSIIPLTKGEVLAQGEHIDIELGSGLVLLNTAFSGGVMSSALFSIAYRSGVGVLSTIYLINEYSGDKLGINDDTCTVNVTSPNYYTVRITALRATTKVTYKIISLPYAWM